MLGKVKTGREDPLFERLDIHTSVTKGSRCDFSSGLLKSSSATGYHVRRISESHNCQTHPSSIVWSSDVFHRRPGLSHHC